MLGLNDDQADRQRADLLSNVEDACQRRLPGVPHRNLKVRPLVFVGGGPSLRDTWPLIAHIKDAFVVVSNDTHEFLREKNIKFDACVMSEVLPKEARLFDNVQKRVGYYIASQTHPTTFRKLEDAGAKMWLWHFDQPGVRDIVGRYRAQGPIIWGGTSGACRLINLAVHGWRARELHVFGLDSSVTDQSHAYEDRKYDTKTVEMAGREFRVNNFLLWQAMTFVDQMRQWPKDVKLTLHGDGLLPHIVSALKQGWTPETV